MTSQHMALSVERSALDAALSRVADTMSKKPVIPITGFVRAEAADGALSLRTCDLDRQMLATIPAEIDHPGAICLPGDTFRDLVKGFAAGAQVRLEEETSGGRCVLKSGRSRYRISTLPATDHPDIGGPKGISFHISGAALKRAIARVSFAVSTAEDRTFLWGARLHIANHEGSRRLALAATNGIMLSRCFMDLPGGLEDLPAVTIPTEALATLARVVPDNGDIVVTVSEERIAVTSGETTFVSKLVEGTFPDYPRIIPALSGRAATVDRAALSSALDRFRTLDHKGAGISVTHTDSALILSGEHSSLGDAREEVEAEIHAAEKLTPFGCVVHRKNLFTILSRFTGEHVLIDQEDASKPIRIVPLSKSDEGHDAVMMPMLMGVRQAED